MAKKEDKAVEVIEEVVTETEEKEDSKKAVEDFIARKLSAINQMEDEAKARRNASRVLSNRKGY